MKSVCVKSSLLKILFVSFTAFAVYRNLSYINLVFPEQPQDVSGTSAMLEEDTLLNGRMKKANSIVSEKKNQQQFFSPEDDDVATEMKLRQAREVSYRKYGIPVSPPKLNDSVPFSSFSHIRYKACCGLGHRLIRQATAAYVARVQGLALRPYWSSVVFKNEKTGGKTDLFLEMFDPYTRDDFPYVNSTNLLVGDLKNEVPLMHERRHHFDSNGMEHKRCPCTNDEIQVHHDFYNTLRSKYKRRELVESFMKRNNFENHTVIGIHVRAGNGEKGDFEGKHRGVHYSPSLWVSSLLKSILAKFPAEKLPRPPIIFLATDDFSYRGYFKSELQNQGVDWPLVTLDQAFRQEGSGVLLNGNSGSNEDLESWHSMFQDMAVLSYSDVLIAPLISSFTQSLPLSLVLGANHHHIQNKFCEAMVVGKSTIDNITVPDIKMYCYDQYMTYCCGKKTQPRHKHSFAKFVKRGARPYGPKVAWKEEKGAMLIKPFPKAKRYNYSLSFEHSN